MKSERDQANQEYAMTEQAIADELGVTRNGVRHIMNRAMEKIRQDPQIRARLRAHLEAVSE